MRLEGKVIPVAHGEAIVCEIPLGVVKLIVISNIPEDGDDATVYVKVRPIDEGSEKRTRSEKKFKPRRSPQQAPAPEIEILRR